MDVILPTRHDQQSDPFTCGAACINMVLSRWNAQQPQPQVWATIQAQTGSVRPGDARPESGSFPTQHCDKCSDQTTTEPDGTVYGDYHCWFTTPEAMAKVATLWAPKTLGPEYLPNRTAAIKRLLDSIALDVPSGFTTPPALHWRVAIGYQVDGPSGGIQWQGQQVTGLYIRDPAVPDPGDVLHMVALDPRGILGVLMAVKCGPYQGTFPVVVKASASIARMATAFLLGFTAALLWLIPWRWRRWRKPTPPGPPPRRSGR